MADRPVVLRLLTRLNIGGPSRHVLILTRDLPHRYATVLAAGRPEADEGELTDASVPVVDVPFVRPVRPTTDLRALVAVRRLLRRHRPVVVHTHMAKAGTIGRLASLTVRPRPILVHTFHGHVLDGYFRPAIARAFLAVERALARRTDALVAVSDEVRDELLALGIGRRDQWRTIALGLELDHLLDRTAPSGRLRRELGVSAPLIGMLGRLVPIKDVATAIRAISIIPDVHLVIVGDGSERAALEALTADLAVADRVHFLGWRHDIADVVTDFDVALLTSRNEGTPVALIEAAAAARPAVATDVGGVRAVVEHGVTGLVVDAGDHSAIAAAITSLIQDPALAASMGAAARERVRARYSSKRLVDDVTRLYDELLARC